MTRADVVFISHTICDMPAFAATLRTTRRSCAHTFAKALGEYGGLKFEFDRTQFLNDCELERGLPE